MPMPRKPKPFPHQGFFYTTAGGSWRKLCPVEDGLDMAMRILGAPPETPFPLASEAADRYFAHCRTYYTLPTGGQSSEPRSVELAFSYFTAAAPALATAQLTKEHLKAAREKMLPTCARKTINQHVGRIKRGVRWWADNGLIPDAAASSLLLLAPLPAFRSGAKEHAPVGPVEWADVQAVVERIAEPWRSLILFQWYTGLRPGEACGLLASQVRNDPWRVEFGLAHKTGWRGKTKTLPLGPHAIAVLEPWLKSAALRNRPFVFATTWTARGTEARPARPSSYAHAVERECVRLMEGRKLAAPWHPNQLRHSFGTRVRAALGLEAAQHALGHARADVTQVYAERDAAIATLAAEKCG